jgi:WD40 repeat protein
MGNPTYGVLRRDVFLSVRRVLVRPAVAVLLLLLVAAALAPVAMAADGSVAPRLVWWARGVDIDFSPNGRLVAVSDYGKLRIREAATGKLVADADVMPNATYPFSLTFTGWSPAGNLIAVSTHPNPWTDPDLQSSVALVAWNGTGLRVDRYLPVPGNYTPVRFAWSPDGGLLATTTNVERIYGDAGENHRGPAIGYVRQPMRIWDAATGSTVATLDWNRSAEGWGPFSTGRLSWDPTGTVLYASYLFERPIEYWHVVRGVAAWDIATGSVLWYRDGISVVDIVPSPDGARVAYVAAGALWIANATTGEVVATRSASDLGAANISGTIAWSTSGGMLYVRTPPGKGTLIAYPELKTVAVVTPPDNAGLGETVSFSPDDRLLAIADHGAVYVYDLAPSPSPLLLGAFVAAGGGVAAAGYGWRRRRRNAMKPEDGP